MGLVMGNGWHIRTVGIFIRLADLAEIILILVCSRDVSAIIDYWRIRQTIHALVTNNTMFHFTMHLMNQTILVRGNDILTYDGKSA